MRGPWSSLKRPLSAGRAESSGDEGRRFLSPPDCPGMSSAGGSGYEDAVERQDGASEKADEETEVSNRPQVAKRLAVSLSTWS